MYARSSHIHARSSAIDAGIAYIHDTVWPALTGLDGYVGLSLLVDRLSGRCIVTTAWQSEEAMIASRREADAMRDRPGAGPAARSGWASIGPRSPPRPVRSVVTSRRCGLPTSPGGGRVRGW